MPVMLLQQFTQSKAYKPEVESLACSCGFKHPCSFWHHLHFPRCYPIFSRDSQLERIALIEPTSGSASSHVTAGQQVGCQGKDASQRLPNQGVLLF
ncbi:hypothetical protein H0G86_001707 [Trichoderma simmonsii]|uniref:Uncharacterized protein n=1 Tax=Trichoderma simmonsii TaxID=1491479 RepID=A0A8G0L234_9HYPO|nr:hypothetical protein H0G86_001707 [Trichoderma simmonsii]